MNIFEVSNYLEFLDASRGVEPDDVVTLTADVEVDDSLVFANKCTINLNNFKLSILENGSIVANKNIHLTFCQGQLQISAEEGLVASGLNSEICLKDNCNLVATTTTCFAYKGGTIRIDGADILVNSETPALFATGANSCIDCISGIIRCENGSAIQVKGDARCVIGGEFCIESDDQSDMSSAPVLINGKNSVCIVTGNANISSNHTSAIKLSNSTCSIESGHIQSSGSASAITLFGNNTTLRVIGGEIHSENSSAINMLQVSSEDYIYYLDVIGGSIIGSDSCIDIAASCSVDFKISGGYFQPSIVNKSWVPITAPLETFLSDEYMIENGYVLLVNGVDPSYLTGTEDIPTDDEPIQDEPTPDEQSDIEGENVSDASLVGQSLILSKPVFITLSPNNYRKGFEAIGVIRVIKVITCTQYSETYYQVETLIRGRGGKLFGYISKSLLLLSIKDDA